MQLYVVTNVKAQSFTFTRFRQETLSSFYKRIFNCSIDKPNKCRTAPPSVLMNVNRVLVSVIPHSNMYKDIIQPCNCKKIYRIVCRYMKETKLFCTDTIFTSRQLIRKHLESRQLIRKHVESEFTCH